MFSPTDHSPLIPCSSWSWRSAKKNILTRLRIELGFFEEQHRICLCSSLWSKMSWSNSVQKSRIFSITSNLSFRFSSVIRFFKFARIVDIGFKSKKSIFTGIFFLLVFKMRVILMQHVGRTCDFTKEFKIQSI